MKPLRVAIIGATGRTGRAVLRLASETPDVAVVAAVTAPGDPLLGQDAGRVVGIGDVGLAIGTDVGAECDVVIEFTLAAGCAKWAAWCAERGIPMVSGTTGLDADQAATVAEAAKRVPIVHAPNMSVGINMMLELVSDVARRLGIDWDVEICETHHRRKVDAPSGTAFAFRDAVCLARGERADESTVFGREGVVGERPEGQIGVHAIRMGELVGQHEVHFTNAAESLTLRHQSYSRDTFAGGALHAARWVICQPAGVYSMRDVLRP